MIFLEGYTIFEKIHDGFKSEIYRGKRKSDSLPVVLKLLKSKYPSPIDIARLQFEYEIYKKMNSPGVLKIYAMENYGNSPVIIMEDIFGKPLKSVINKEPLNLNTFLWMSMKITETLAFIHKNHIVHKDINPNNIIINLDTEEIRIIDFGNSTQLSKESMQAINVNRLEGTLKYISPEQTGRMNRTLDYRTDFYSLGVTFYEMLTGKLPFESKDNMELVHCHIARRPVNIKTIKPDIPDVISEIVMKLLEKDPERRYQSASGLYFDLEECFSRFESSGKVEYFEIGKNDIINEFRVSQKLYGREKEIKILMDAYKRVCIGNIELMLVSGFSGIGKSSIVNEIHKPIVENKGYFISGKFDQYKRNIPYSALIDAFKMIVQQILSESNEDINYWREKILNALGQNTQIIADVVPEVEMIVGKQPVLPDLAAIESQNRFNLTFQKFVRTLCSEEHPLTIFLDDLQWADLSSLKIIEILMGDIENKYMFIIGAYRDNEISGSHPLMLTVKEIEKTAASLTMLLLMPLDLDSVNQLMSDTLMREPDKTKELSELCIQKTGGNPFFLNQFLCTLNKDNFITFDNSLNMWRWNISSIKNIGVTENILDLMVKKIKKLPKNTQDILKLAACIGNTFDLRILSIISGKSPDKVSEDIWDAFLEEMVIPLDNNYKYTGNTDGKDINYRFLHDKIQQASYSLITSEERKVIHLKIGRMILENIPENEREEKLFDLVNHFNFAIDLIDSIDERDLITKLNFEAGKKAKASAAYEPAYNYFSSGIKLLGNDSWERQYDTAVSIYIEAAEAAYLSLNFESMDTLIQTVLNKAKTAIEKARVYEIKIQAYIAQNNLRKAVETSRHALSLFGIKLPEKGSLFSLLREVLKVIFILSGRKVEKLSELPQMSDPNILSVMRIMSDVISILYYTDSKLSIIISFKQVMLSIKYGNAPASHYAYTAFGVFISGLLGRVDLGYRYGELALSLVEESKSKQYRAKIYSVASCCLRIWKEPLDNVLTSLLDGYKYGFEDGDFEFAGHCARSYVFILFCSGKELNDIENKVETFRKVVSSFKQKTALNYLEMLGQMIFNLKSETENILILSGEIYNEEGMLPIHLQENERRAIAVVYVYKYMLCYYFEDYNRAVDLLEKAEEYLDSVFGNYEAALFHLYNALARLAIYSSVEKDKQKQYLRKINSSSRKIKKWTKHCPWNFQNKFYLIEAERARVFGQDSKAMEYYNKSIELAKENGFIQEEAMANELAGKFYLERKLAQVGEVYLRNAHYCYFKWGAQNKAKAMELKYPDLFSSKSEVNFITSKSTSSTNSAEALDMASILKATQAISGEILLDKLLKKLIQIVLENAGAQRVVFIIKRGSDLIVEATGSIESNEVSVMMSIPIDKYNDISMSIINYVSRTRDSIVLDDASALERTASDAYIILNKPKSVLCVPISNKGDVTGILYLENNLTSGAFTEDRIKILNILSSQLAISMENANLYTHLDELVNERTKELSSALENLKSIQSQLIESEKMAALGQLVAGISHEINTPVGVSITSASFLQQKTAELKQLYEGGKIKREDLEGYLEICGESGRIILANAMRAGNLIRSFKQVAVDQSNDERRKFNMREYIEHILLSLSPKLKSAKHNVKINCRDELEVICSPAAIAQIITNFIVNSIKHGYDFGETGNISIDIQEIKGKILLKYSDDGKGINEEYLNKIYEPFFTTKRSSGGTGLGLNIVYNNVSQKLGGTIKCISEEGKGTTFIIEFPNGIE